MGRGLVMESRTERDIMAIMMHPEIWAHINGPVPATVPQMISSVRNQANRFFIAGKGDGVVCVLWNGPKSLDVHFAFRRRCHGTGVCLDAVKRVVGLLRTSEPGKDLVIRFFPNRPDVRRFTEKLGFTMAREGVRVGSYFMEEWKLDKE